MEYMLLQIEKGIDERSLMWIQFIKNSEGKFVIPFKVLCDRQAQINHGQSLAELNRRGGISIHEALALSLRRRFYEVHNVPFALAAMSLIRIIKISPYYQEK